MCGRVFVKTSVAGLMRALAFVRREEGDGLDDLSPRYNGPPGQDYPLIVAEADVPGAVFMLAKWGLIAGWMKDPRGKPSIIARSETIATKPMFRAAYRSRRALMPVHGFFEWHDVHGDNKNKKPYAIAMKDGKSFCIAAVWERWRNPKTGQTIKTFAVVTCESNELIAKIHPRMPVILTEASYTRWLGDDDPDPVGLMRAYPAELMTMWPISKRVNSPRNDDPALLDLFEE